MCNLSTGIEISVSFEHAKKLLAMGCLTLEQIAEVTSLPLEEIKKLQTRMAVSAQT